MLIRLLSDLHNEFSVFNIPRLEEDAATTLVLAGDICVAEKKSSYKDFIPDACNRFKHVVYICGNHEYYGSSIHTASRKIKEVTQQIDNFHFLDNEVFEHDGVAFIGATLWTDLKGLDPMVEYQVANTINDYKTIRYGTVQAPYQSKLRPIHTFGFNKTSKEFIFDSVKKYKAEGKKTVVVSHHAPSWKSVPDIYKSGLISYAYANEYDSLIEGCGPDNWLHGHTHTSFNYKIGETEIWCNPRGYSESSDGSQNPFFNPRLRFEL
jgi:Icc-related predicted phosphoesterase